MYSTKLCMHRPVVLHTDKQSVCTLYHHLIGTRSEYNHLAFHETQHHGVHVKWVMVNKATRNHYTLLNKESIKYFILHFRQHAIDKTVDMRL